jgi:protein-tyrosine-phosphatase
MPPESLATAGAGANATERDILLFLCVANSARSQMAEGIARTLAPRGLEIHSAGSSPSQVHPLAIAALREIGIEIGSHRSKSVFEIDSRRVRTVVTLCAEEVCPAQLADAERLDWPLPDPAATAGDDSAKLETFRRVRDRLRGRLRRYFATLER